MRSLLWHGLIWLGYFALALVVVGHLPSSLSDHFIGSDTGDSYEMARNVWWFTYALQHDEPLYTQTWLGYPDGIDGSILMAVPLQYFPMWALAFFLPLPIAYNLTLLGYMALNGWSLYFLAQQRLKQARFTVPALLAGAVYLAFPLFQGHLAEGHGGLMVAWAAPLYLWALFGLVDAQARVWRWGILSVICFYLSTSGHILQAIYVLMPVTGAFLLARLWLRDWRGAVRVMLMGMVASLLLLLILAPAIRDAGNEAYRTTTGFVRYSADVLAIVTPSFLHPAFEQLSYSRTILGTNLGEGLAYIGVIAGGLALLAMITCRPARWWGFLGMIAYLLALGPRLKILNTVLDVPMPFALLQALPGFALARTPARFNFTLAIAVAMLVAYGAAWLWQQDKLKGWRYLIAIIFAIGIVYEYQSFWGQPLRSATVPQAVIDLRADPAITAIFNIPYQHALAAKDALYLQTAHQQPLIGGQITRTTPVNAAKLALLQETLFPHLLRQAGAQVVILHRRRASSIGVLSQLESQAYEQLGAPFYQDADIALYRVPVSQRAMTIDYDYERPDIRFGEAIMLRGYQHFSLDGQVYVWLRWQALARLADTDVRFVHLVNEAGEIVQQFDAPLGTLSEGDSQAEILHFVAQDLPTGQYTVRIGWYAYPSLNHYLTEEGRSFYTAGSFTLDESVR